MGKINEVGRDEAFFLRPRAASKQDNTKSKSNRGYGAGDEFVPPAFSNATGLKLTLSGAAPCNTRLKDMDVAWM